MAMLMGSCRFIMQYVRFLVFFGIFYWCDAARVSDKIYEGIQGNMACFKRFNGTHEVGCTSDFKGNVGVLYIPNNATDFKWALEHGPHPPYIFALKPELFIRELLLTAKDSNNIRGIVVFDSENYTKPTDMSPASTCPSHEYGIYNESSQSEFSDYCSSDPWNEVGNSLLFESFSFPIFLIQDSDSINAITKCFAAHNRDSDDKNMDWPLCALELHSNMFGTTNSEVCLRRTQGNVLWKTNYCDPIHDYNIVGSLNAMSEDIEDSSVIIIAARADAATLFDNISPGADSAVTGIVTLLAVAEALHDYKLDINVSNKHILFVLFEGETWDYLGSSSITYDMSLGEFPFAPVENQTDQVSNINFSHIAHFIELSQLGIQSSSVTTKAFLHLDPISNKNPTIAQKNDILRNALKKAAEDQIVLDESNIGKPLPPASFQNFLKHLNISGAVLADHGERYSNKYYQGVLDNDNNVKFLATINGSNPDDQLHQHISKIASTIASAVYSLTTGIEKKVNANSSLVSELLVCYLKNVNCTLFREHSGRYLSYSGTVPYFQPEPAKMYTSVQGGEEILTNITLYLLADFLGDQVDSNEHECWSNRTSAVQMFFMPTMGYNGTCFVSTPRKLSADSPAFRIQNYDFSSGEYPTWTESGWSSTSARLFLKPSPSEEIGLVVGGILFILASTILSYWAHSRSNVLFVKTPVPTQC